MTDCKRPAITKLAPPELELPELAREPPGVPKLPEHSLRAAVEASIALADLGLDLRGRHVLVALEGLEARHGRVVELPGAPQHLVQRRAGVRGDRAELDLIGVQGVHQRQGLIRHGGRLLGEADHAEGPGLDPHIPAGPEYLVGLVHMFRHLVHVILHLHSALAELANNCP